MGRCITSFQPPQTEEYHRPFATELRKKSLIPFSNNEKKVNRLVGFFNGFNLVFGSYFLFSSFGTQVNLAKETASSLYEFVVLLLARSGVVAEPVSTVTIGLGVIPVIFSALFFLIPIIRNLRFKTKKSISNRGISSGGYIRIFCDCLYQFAIRIYVPRQKMRIRRPQDSSFLQR